MRTFSFFLFFLISLSSCQDACNDACMNDSTCIDGTCLCTEGYEGDSCETEIRGSFIGFWNGNAICNEVENGVINMEISRDESDPLEVLISFPLTNSSIGLTNYEIIVQGNVVDATRLEILETSILTPNNLLLINGTASLSDDIVTMNMKFIIQNQSTTNCVFTVEKE